jgi:hypothetical protein
MRSALCYTSLMSPHCLCSLAIAGPPIQRDSLIQLVDLLIDAKNTTKGNQAP